jgi:hypothetical protein
VVVALQGSLEDFALPDVLALLASTKKTGELHVSGDRGGGRLWLRGGEVVWAEAGDATDAVDCLFELLRVGGGQFRFTADVDPPEEGPPTPVDPLLAEAAARLAEWEAIERVVPSLRTVVRLEPEPPAAEVVVSAEQWRVLVAVADGGTVSAVARALGTGEFGACRAVAELVGAGLVAVVAGAAPEARSGAADLDDLVHIPRRDRPAAEPAAGPAVGDAAVASGEPGPEPAAEGFVRQLAVIGRGDEEEPDVEVGGAEAGVGVVEAGASPHLAAADTDGDAALVDENGEPINRSLLLKFLSSVRS